MSENSSSTMKIFDSKNLKRYLIMNSLALYYSFLVFNLYPIASWDFRFQNAILIILLIIAFWQNSYLYTEQIFKSRIEFHSKNWSIISKYIDIMMWFSAIICLGGSLFYSIGFVHMIIFYIIYTIYLCNMLIGLLISIISLYNVNN